MNDSGSRSDVIVIGGGTMGIAAGWALARRGKSVLILEQYDFFHTNGSHGGATRVFRHGYFEGANYVPWTIEGDRLIAELQDRTGIEMQIRNGCLDFGTSKSGHARLVQATAEVHGLRHEMLTGSDINRRFPGWNVPNDWEGCFDPDGGTLINEGVFTGLRQEFEAAGGVLHTNEKVTGFEESTNGVTVTTDTATYSADHLVVTAGAWSSKVLRQLDLPIKVTRKPVMWFEVEDRNRFIPENFPAFICSVDAENQYYGLPAVGDNSLKMGIHTDMNVIDPDDFDRDVSPEDLLPEFREFITTRMNGVSGNLVNTAMCMYSMTPDQDFIIDRVPGHDRIAFAAGFSGHGFKFIAVVGEYLADLVEKPELEPRSDFALNRFGQAAD